MKALSSTLKISKKVAKQVLKNYKSDSKVIAQIVKVIKANEKFVLTTHIGADADGLGSQVGLFYLLKKLKKKVVIINNEAPPEYLSFIFSENLVLNINDLDDSDMKKHFTDAHTLILDSSELKRSDKVGQVITRLKVNWSTIDHHILPPKKNFFVDPDYPATCEIIWDVYKAMGETISPKAAIALYTGLIADTGNFRFPKTSFRTHLAGADLLSLNINSEDVYRAIYEFFPFDRLVLLKRMLNEAEFNRQLGYVITEIRNDMISDLNLGDSKSEGIVNMLLAVKEMKISAVLIETSDGFLKGSLRSVGDIDVAKIAKKFDGGGHKNAAGLKISEVFSQAKLKIAQEIQQYLSSKKK